MIHCQPQKRIAVNYVLTLKKIPPFPPNNNYILPNPAEPEAGRLSSWAARRPRPSHNMHAFTWMLLIKGLKIKHEKPH